VSTVHAVTVRAVKAHSASPPSSICSPSLALGDVEVGDRKRMRVEEPAEPCVHPFPHLFRGLGEGCANQPSRHSSPFPVA